MRVKICGITNLEDALWAIEYGADALGFVFYEKSPRYISVDKAREIVDILPPFIERVGLFVNCDSSHVNRVCFNTQMSLAQIHFEPEVNFFEELKYKYMRVIRADSKEKISNFADGYRIVDAFVDSYGGEGKRVDLSWFDNQDCSNIILASGLDSQNLEEVIKYNFYGVDVSSGVEAFKGKKDRLKMKNFIEMVKNG